jgi:hypothetical protein
MGESEKKKKDDFSQINSVLPPVVANVTSVLFSNPTHHLIDIYELFGGNNSDGAY